MCRECTTGAGRGRGATLSRATRGGATLGSTGRATSASERGHQLAMVSGIMASRLPHTGMLSTSTQPRPRSLERMAVPSATVVSAPGRSETVTWRVAVRNVTICTWMANSAPSVTGYLLLPYLRPSAWPPNALRPRCLSVCIAVCLHKDLQTLVKFDQKGG